MIFFCTSDLILCLQEEADDDTKGNIAFHLSNKSNDVGTAATSQVITIVSDDSVTLDTFNCFCLFYQWYSLQKPLRIV